MAFVSHKEEIRCFNLNKYQRLYTKIYHIYDFDQLDKSIDWYDTLRAILYTGRNNIKQIKWFVERINRTDFIKFDSIEDERDFFGDMFHNVFFNVYNDVNGSVSEEKLRLLTIYEAHDTLIFLYLSGFAFIDGRYDNLIVFYFTLLQFVPYSSQYDRFVLMSNIMEEYIKFGNLEFIEGFINSLFDDPSLSSDQNVLDCISPLITSLNCLFNITPESVYKTIDLLKEKGWTSVRNAKQSFESMYGFNILEKTNTQKGTDEMCENGVMIERVIRKINQEHLSF